MIAWTCPECQRPFARRGQSHDCAPGLTLDEYFSTGEPLEREVYDAVIAHLEGVGPQVIEYLSVGIFFKRPRSFAQLRPKRDRKRRLRIELIFMLARRVKHARFAQTWHGSGQRSAYSVNLYSANDVDDEVRDWLTEAYLASPS